MILNLDFDASKFNVSLSAIFVVILSMDRQ